MIDVEENYRKTFDEKKLAELAKSIKKNGVIQPIVVRTKGGQSPRSYSGRPDASDEMRAAENRRIEGRKENAQ